MVRSSLLVYTLVALLFLGAAGASYWLTPQPKIALSESHSTQPEQRITTHSQTTPLIPKKPLGKDLSEEKVIISSARKHDFVISVKNSSNNSDFTTYVEEKINGLGLCRILLSKPEMMRLELSQKSRKLEPDFLKRLKASPTTTQEIQKLFTEHNEAIFMKNKIDWEGRIALMDSERGQLALQSDASRSSGTPAIKDFLKAHHEEHSSSIHDRYDTRTATLYPSLPKNSAPEYSPFESQLFVDQLQTILAKENLSGKLESYLDDLDTVHRESRATHQLLYWERAIHLNAEQRTNIFNALFENPKTTPQNLSHFLSPEQIQKLDQQ